jgi:hypothetical protein
MPNASEVERGAAMQERIGPGGCVKEVVKDWSPDEDEMRRELEVLNRAIEELRSPEAEAIRRIGYDLTDWLVKKNEQYGSSAFDPVRIFSKADLVEQIKVRLDDKLSRLARRNDSMETDDDVIRDLAGYLIIYLAARELQEKGNE